MPFNKILRKLIQSAKKQNTITLLTTTIRPEVVKSVNSSTRHLPLTVKNPMDFQTFTSKKSDTWKKIALMAAILALASKNRQALTEEENREIIEIRPGETIKHKGSLHIKCDIPENVTIEVTDGDLIIERNVGTSANIKLLVTPKNLSSQPTSFYNFCFSFFTTNNVTKNNGNHSSIIINDQYYDLRYHLKINGTIHSKTKIDAMGEIICNDIMEKCEIRSELSITTGNIGKLSIICSSNGDLSLGNIMDRTHIQTINGKISAKNIHHNAVIKSTNGNITVMNVAGDVRISTINGTINARKVSDHARISTINGNITADEGDENNFSTINGTICKNDRPITRKWDY